MLQLRTLKLNHSTILEKDRVLRPRI